MKTPKPSLAAQVRLQWCALATVLFVAATPAAHVHLLNLLDANNRPASPVDLSGTGWTGTLDAARLPASVPVLDDQNRLHYYAFGLYNPTVVGGYAGLDNNTGLFRTSDAALIQGNLTVIGGPSSLDGGAITTDGAGGLSITGNLVSDHGAIDTDGDGNLFAGGSVDTPTLYLGDTLSFVTAGSSIFADGDALYFSDQYGAVHTLAFAP